VTAPRIARLALVVVAVSAAVVLVSFQRSEDACTDSVKAMFFALRDRVPDAQLDPTVASVEDDCPGSARLVDAGAVLFQQGQTQQAESVLREAVEREPESFSAWAGLASVLAKAEPAASADAAARAKELNPFYRPPS
jgi:predicted Zn-dependent protease